MPQEPQVLEQGEHSDSSKGEEEGAGCNEPWKLRQEQSPKRKEAATKTARSCNPRLVSSLCYNCCNFISTPTAIFMQSTQRFLLCIRRAIICTSVCFRESPLCSKSRQTTRTLHRVSLKMTSSLHLTLLLGFTLRSDKLQLTGGCCTLVPHSIW